MLHGSRSRATALVLALGALSATVAGCGSSDDAASNAPVVVATAPQIDGLLQELAGGGVEVAPVVAATADVHELELRPSQVRALTDAELVLRPGRDNDLWAQEALDRVEGTQVDVSAELPGDERHWWMDPAMAETAATTIAAELDKIDPAGKAERAEKLQGVVQALRAVDAETKQCLASVPAADRVIVTDHDAAGAYADRYGLTVAGTIAPGADPEGAPSAQRIVELVTTMKARGVKAVFPIAPHGSELSKTVAERGGAALGDPLWADALPGATHEEHDEHGGETEADHAEHAGEAEAEHAGEAEAEHAGETEAEHAEHAGEGEPTLQAAAELNGRAVAEALGAKPAACGDLLG